MSRMVLVPCLLAAAMAASPAAANWVCVQVDAQKGWQGYDFPAGSVYGFDASGTWTVDAANLEPVDFHGHYGPAAEMMAPWNDEKILLDADFGELLMTAGQSVHSVYRANRVLADSGQVMKLDKITALWFRINDSDDSLDNNSGELKVCLIYE